VNITYSTDATQEQIERFIKSFLNDGLVYEVAEVVGEHDLMIRVWESSLNKLNSHVRGYLNSGFVVFQNETQRKIKYV